MVRRKQVLRRRRQRVDRQTVGTDTTSNGDDDEWHALAVRFEDADAYTAVVDYDFVLRGACSRAHSMFGLNPNEVVGKSAIEVIHPADLERALSVFTETASYSGLRPPDVYRIRVNGTDSPEAEYRAFDVAGENLDELGGAVVFQLRELSDRRRAEMLAIEQIEILETLGSGATLETSIELVANLAERHIDASACVITTFAPDGTLRSYQPKHSRYTMPHDWDGERIESCGPNVREATRRRLSYVELDIRDLAHWSHVSGPESVFVTAVTTPAHDPTGKLVGFVEVIRSTDRRPDNAEMSVHALVSRLVGLLADRHQFESILADAAHKDSLTGLGNRRLLVQRLDELDESGAPYALYAIDLDQFAWINNNLGHLAGDQLLKNVAERFVGVLPSSAQAFRQGGDEFAIILTGDLNPTPVQEIGRRLVASLDEPVPMGVVNRQVRASIGVATSKPNDSGEKVLARADAAMYAAKADGGAGFRVFSESDGRSVMRRMTLADQLRGAITNNELRLAYQPKFDLHNRRITGVEALVRWEHPSYGLLAPEEFVPIAEESTTILELDRWVLGHAYAQLTEWSASRPSHDPLEVWVNLSARSLDRPDLVDLLIDLVGGDPAPLLGLELTERGGFDDITKTKTVFRRLSEAGFKVAIDDFGTGQASLQHLAELDVTSIKIDRSFVSNMAESRRYRIMIETILALGRSLGLSVTAEGIETSAQLRTLQELGCSIGQGYLMSRPMLPEALEREFGTGLIERWDPLSISSNGLRGRRPSPLANTRISD